LLIAAFSTAIIAACGSGSGAVASTTPSAKAAVATAAASLTPVALYTCGTRALAWDGTSSIDLTGTWNGDDEGVYYLRQVGDQIWWLGMSGLGKPISQRGSDWTNVYSGTLSGGTITGTYADVPQGKILDKGPVVLKLTSTTGDGIALVRSDPVLETGFGGTLLTPCVLG
jgi:hypothetical protein